MKVLLDIKDAKADFMMELLNSFSFVKAKPLTGKKAKAKILADLDEAVEELKQVRAGKARAIPLQQLLDEL